MNQKLNITLLIAVLVVSVGSLITSMILYFLPGKDTIPVAAGEIALRLDPDSTSATFAKNNQAEVYLVAKNISSKSVNLMGIDVVLKINKNNLEMAINTGFLPTSDWTWLPNSGLRESNFRISGATGTNIVIAPNQELRLAILNFTPKASSVISFKEEVIYVADSNSDNVFDGINTPNQQIFNITK